MATEGTGEEHRDPYDYVNCFDQYLNQSPWTHVPILIYSIVVPKSQYTFL